VVPVGRSAPPALIAIGKQSGNRSSSAANSISLASDRDSSVNLIDPTNFLMPVMDSGKDDPDFDADNNIKVEDDDDDDEDDRMDDDKYTIGYYPHASSLLVSKND